MKTLIIMRGLPWTGKSYRAKELAGETGVIFSTDEYWHTQVKPERPEEYSFDRRLLPTAHKWNQLRAQDAINWSKPLIIIDNTNTTAAEAKPYVEYGYINDYEIRIEEPTSPQWLAIRPLLANKKSCKKELREWAAKLAKGSQETHNVPAFAIEQMMWRWQNGLTVDQILDSQEVVQ